ncbi:MAG: DNA polymerase/3'-5' exonuclease PolX [Candidatus Omnitrophica bacterium]|nr:DNA polymerase/3'-5' exonuclease PolX [Candidatus Omnitrophota bacterium]MDD5430234.1 DNA polymerase/3'-5' exonuclease PolX [Candidatus Omnitrophota bacterium]
MQNKDISHIFREIAKILELKGENLFRIRAYERAAQTIEDLPESIVKVYEEKRLTSLPGIGNDLAKKVEELVTTGLLNYYHELKKQIPSGVIDMLGISGLGPKTVKLLYDNLGIDSIEKLEKACRQGSLLSLEGIKEKTQSNILRGVELYKHARERIYLHLGLDIAEKIIKQLKSTGLIEKIEIAGSLRRKKENAKDIDILAVSKKPSEVMDAFTASPLAAQVLVKGQTKSSVLANERNIQVDLRIVGEKNFGSALMYFTGSKDFNIKMRQLAIKKGYHLNEYGLFSDKDSFKKRTLASKSEKEIFSFLGMAYIPPELREARGEIEASLEDNLPELVEFGDIRGDFHIHSDYSDGSISLEEIVLCAKDKGYEYVGICDHSQSLKVARGLSVSLLHKKIEAVRMIDNRQKNIKVFCGSEVDILAQGKLDYPDSVLKEIDFVIAAIHSGFKQSKQELTQRIVRACQNPYVRAIAHPTGGLRGLREPYEIDFDEVFKAARDYNTALEINCHPERMDLSDTRAMAAQRFGVKLILGTDAHNAEQFDLMAFGVNAARRAWLERQDVINCLSLDELSKWLGK